MQRSSEKKGYLQVIRFEAYGGVVSAQVEEWIDIEIDGLID